MELQQSVPYAAYIRSLHWHVETIDGVNIFVRKFPFAGGIAKFQRIATFPSIEKLLPLFKKFSVRRIVLEAAPHVDEKKFKSYAKALKTHVNVLQTPYIPTKTILVDLTLPEEKIFSNFSEAKRRAVRRAQKNNIEVSESDQIDQLIQVKNKSAGLFGFITTTGAKQMWDAFSPDHATTVLAMSNEPIGGIFLVFWENTAYYWIAGATKKGKHLAAPTLLVWEALKIAKKKGMKQFDFVGVWDERFPKDNKDWLGFTKFKEGFGGKELYYPTHK